MKQVFRISFFGSLTEYVGETLEMEVNAAMNSAEFKAFLLMGFPQLEGIPLKVAQNNELLEDNTLLEFGDVSVFPPFSGG